MGPLWRDIRGATKLRALTMHSGEGGAPRQQLGARGPAAGWHFRKARVGSLRQGLEGWSRPIRQIHLQPGLRTQPWRLFLGGPEPPVTGQNPASGAGAGREQEDEASRGSCWGQRRGAGLPPLVLQPGRPEPRLTLLPFLPFLLELTRGFQ